MLYSVLRVIKFIDTMSLVLDGFGESVAENAW